MGKVDKELKDFLEFDDVAVGDEFGAIKPWRGAIVEPQDHPPINPTKPDFSYSIDFVYGYRTEDVRMNLFYNQRGLPVYMSAAIGIIFTPKTRNQVYFGGGETDFSTRK